MKSHVLAISVTALLILIFFSYKLYVNATSNAAASDISVETVVVQPQSLFEKWYAVGSIKATQDIIISTEVTGVIETLNVKANQAVQENDILLQIRHNDILAKIQKDQAALLNKRNQYNRLLSLNKSRYSASPAELDEALSDFQQAEADLAEDQSLLTKYIIKAPFAGEVGIWKVDDGQTVKQGDELISLTQLTPTYVDFMLSPKALNAVKIGDKIIFTTTAYPDRSWNGSVIAIEPRLESETRGLQVRAEVDNQDKKLVPSLYGKVTLLAPLPPQILVPQAAIIYEPTGVYVFVIKKQVVDKLSVTLASHQDDNVIVSSGLKAGDEVVTSGITKVGSGDKVVVTKQVKQPPEKAPSSLK